MTEHLSVFISYAHADKAVARKLAEGLQTAGLRVWIDEGELRTGDSIVARIATAIGEVEFVLALVSKNSLSSKWCSKELSLAVNKGLKEGRVRVLPVKLDDVEMPPTLQDTSYLQASSNNPTEILDRLIRDVRSHAVESGKSGAVWPDAEPGVRSNTRPTLGRSYSTVLKTNLTTPLLAQLKKHSKRDLARRIGIAPHTLTAMLNDDWEYIVRGAIQRTADYLKLNSGELFEFVPVEFWESIGRAKNCTFLRGYQETKNKLGRIQIPRYDLEATQTILSFLHELPHFDGANNMSVRVDSDQPFGDHNHQELELLNRAKEENCIVIGSPKSNVATEILLSRYFGALPFDPSSNNRRKISFGFCWTEDSSLISQSSLACSSQARRAVSNRCGISAEGILVLADCLQPDEFSELQIDRGLDCGLVFVANSPFATNHDVKLIVVAGFSGIGTLGAAKALIRSYRYLEPIGSESFVYGIVQCRYSKAANSNVRRLNDFEWKYRKGGHQPILARA